MSTMIRTERLVFEPVTPAAAISIINGDLTALKVGDGWPHEDTRDGLGGVAHGADAWLVMLDGVVIGDCGTHGPADSAGDIELGYGLAAPYRGRGFGNEVAAGLSQHLLAQPGVRRVVANEILAENTPSRRALERAGFTLVRSTPDLAWYALSRP
jgi:RimJ/RimL family protein N-acetyltransferase